MIKDPTAAAMAYGLDDPATKGPGAKKVAVMDFGGGENLPYLPYLERRDENQRRETLP
jgi:hypothetical protein